jgi:hypothetical protein
MGNRGIVYLVRAQRRDGRWIDYRTCDQAEAARLAATLHVPVTVASSEDRGAST